MTPYMIVDDVSEEYQYVRAQECEGCGFKGSYEVKMQKLMDIDGKPHDILECKCRECGAEKSFTFDVSNAFAKYDEMFKKPAKGK
jgi:hypothetical protein